MKLTFPLRIYFFGEISLCGKHLNSTISDQNLTIGTDSDGVNQFECASFTDLLEFRDYCTPLIKYSYVQNLVL